MKSFPLEKICIVPQVHGVGGMVSFRRKLTDGLRARQIEVCSDPSAQDYSAVLVIGGTRRIWELRRARQAGIRVVQRLDGMNWLHRRSAFRRLDLRHYLRAEYGNLVLSLIRTRLATHIVYQSRFVQDWWERVHGPAPVPTTVIYNGVDLNVYSPNGPEQPPSDRRRLLMVEGSLMGGYEGGLDVALQLLGQLCVSPADRTAEPLYELVVAGRAADDLRARADKALQRLAPAAILTWAGLVAPEAIPGLDRSAHLLYSADINAACPNAAVEAMACGLPVLGFATGALPELVDGDAGRIVDYGGDPWMLDPPDTQALAAAAKTIFNAGDSLRIAARQRAEAVFGLEPMVAAYLSILLG